MPQVVDDDGNVVVQLALLLEGEMGRGSAAAQDTTSTNPPPPPHHLRAQHHKFWALFQKSAGTVQDGEGGLEGDADGLMGLMWTGEALT